MAIKICVLIPSYNEARTIGRIVKDLRAKGLIVYVVDDGSTDETSSISLSNGALIIRHEKNMGKGASLRDGFSRIVSEGYDAVLVMDGDDQHEVSSVSEFISTMEATGADIVIGNRMNDTSRMPFVRIVTNRFMSYLISRIARHRVPDTQCGFRLIKTDVLKKIELRSSNFETESEFIIKAARSGFRIESIPIKALYRDEKSKINPIIDTFRFVKLLLRIAKG